MKRIIAFTFMALISSNLCAVDEKLGATGKIKRMIINHGAHDDEILISTDDPYAACIYMPLRTSDPNVSTISYKNLVSYLLAAKISGKTVQLYTDQQCNLFRAEIVD